MAGVILGLSSYYHDSAATLLVDGEIVAAAHEERFTRKKHDAAFPQNAIKYVLSEVGLTLADVEIVVFYDKPHIKFEKLLETYHSFAPRGLKNFLFAVPVWLREKLFMKKTILEELDKLGKGNYKLLFPGHHLSHAASAFYPSPFDEAAILTIDGVGEWATTAICHGQANRIRILKELTFPHSVGLLYSAFTYYAGFIANSNECKLMELAPYGDPNAKETREFIQKIKSTLVDIRADGSILLNMDYFSFATGPRICNNKKWEKLFGLPGRSPNSRLNQSHMNMSLAIQQVTEEIILKLAKTTQEITGSKNLVMAGGVALNCVANGKLHNANIFDNIWVQPAAGDAGGALGAALAAWHIWKAKKRTVKAGRDIMKGAYLGPEFNNKEVLNTLKKYKAEYTYHEDFNRLSKEVAIILSKGSVVGWFQGRMEFGPRALGNRSILGDPRNPEMQKRMNLKIKYQESFRPFAPSVLEEDLEEYFDLKAPSPYMLLVFPVKETRRFDLPENYYEKPLLERLYYLRSDLPSITHIDYSARIQSVSKDTNHKYWTLLNSFKDLTGYGLLINTSFNVRGEPIVCTPEEAYKCFMSTEMDYLVINNYILSKTSQKEHKAEIIEKKNSARPLIVS